MFSRLSLLLVAVIQLKVYGVWSAGTLFRIGSDEFYCLPQRSNATSAGWAQLAQNSEPYITSAVLLDTPSSCAGQQVQGTQTSMSLTKGIAVVASSNCSFGSFQQFEADLLQKISTASRTGATAAVVTLSAIGQLPHVIQQELPLPVCLMDADNGQRFRGVLQSNPTAILDFANMAELNLTQVAAATSENITALQITGSTQITAPLPAWPALFNTPQPAVLNRPVGIVQAEWIPGCLGTEDSGANMFAQCAQNCWNQATPFSNAENMRGNIVLFPNHELSLGNSQEPFCYPEFWQLAYLAQSTGNALASLFVAHGYTAPVVGGPANIPTDAALSAFSILLEDGLRLASEVTAIGSTQGIKGAVPAVTATARGYPPLYNKTLSVQPTSSMSFKGAGSQPVCVVGSAQFSSPGSRATANVPAVFGSATGPCSLRRGLGCTLNTTNTTNASGRVLLLHAQDFTYFSAWRDFVDLASSAQATGLVVVNADESVYTLVEAANYTSAFPVWNVGAVCGAQMQYAASSGTNFTVSLPAVTAAAPTATGQIAANTVQQRGLANPANHYAPQEVSIQVAGKSISAGQAIFNPGQIMAMNTTVVAVEVASACKDAETAGGTSCGACQGLTPAQQLAAIPSVEGQVALLATDGATCLLPHQSIVEELAQQGAVGVLFTVSSGSMKHVSAATTDGTRPSIPAFVVPASSLSDRVTGQAFTAPAVDNSPAADCADDAACVIESSQRSAIIYSADPFMLDAPAQVPATTGVPATTPASSISSGGSAAPSGSSGTSVSAAPSGSSGQSGTGSTGSSAAGQVANDEHGSSTPASTPVQSRSPSNLHPATGANPSTSTSTLGASGSSSSSTGSSVNLAAIVAPTVVGGVLLLALAAVAVYMIRKRRRDGVFEKFEDEKHPKIQGLSPEDVWRLRGTGPQSSAPIV
jgi:hypothetical protein